MQAHMLAEPGLTVAQPWEQKFFASFYKKEGLSCPAEVSLNKG